MISARVVRGGNVELAPVVLLPDTYAALMRIAERSGIGWADAINLAVVTLDTVLTLHADDVGLREALGQPSRLRHGTPD